VLSISCHFEVIASLSPVQVSFSLSLFGALRRYQLARKLHTATPRRPSRVEIKKKLSNLDKAVNLNFFSVVKAL
jgi:hypothetical protein